MPDRYVRFVNSRMGKGLAKRLGLPPAAPLRRYTVGEAEFIASASLGSAPGGTCEAIAKETLTQCDITIRRQSDDDRIDGIFYDASGIRTITDLNELYEFFPAQLRRLNRNGRVVIASAALDDTTESDEAVIVQTALEGFARSLGKEVRPGATVQLIRVPAGAEQHLAAPLRFFFSRRSAFVSGQVVSLDARCTASADGWDLKGQTAIVTGAVGGIGRSTVEVLAAYGAHVVCVDVPAVKSELEKLAQEMNGTAVALDVTSASAATDLAAALPSGADVIVHNAGITRDKTLARMSREQWQTVLDINLEAPRRITNELLNSGKLNSGARQVVLSSVSGIAGNRGQSNYATSKAGLVGLTHALAGPMREREGSVNAIAPGFIETKMTAKMPTMTREVARRLSSLGQGGSSVDVAETIGWLSLPGSRAVNGQTVRVCGQNLMGA
ncbi:3-oxoacyl-ACP reductase [Haloglycomyces albus]|uniref:3-oxoacyl-ACP reductase n=1 Tax=Haloglycomyces albus TaxID=526067 RepID=UPI00046C9258|nr:3-oxoacyl-ACP reductase [Haloglycomyces albus]